MDLNQCFVIYRLVSINFYKEQKYNDRMNSDARRILIGKRLKNYRKARGLTQEKLCGLLNIDISGLSSTENGKSSPLADNLLDIMEILKIKPGELLDFLEYETTEEDLINKVLVEEIKSLSPKNREKVMEFIKLIKK